MDTQNSTHTTDALALLENKLAEYLKKRRGFLYRQTADKDYNAQQIENAVQAIFCSSLAVIQRNTNAPATVRSFDAETLKALLRTYPDGDAVADSLKSVPQDTANEFNTDLHSFSDGKHNFYAYLHHDGLYNHNNRQYTTTETATYRLSIEDPDGSWGGIYLTDQTNDIGIVADAMMFVARNYDSVYRAVADCAFKQTQRKLRYQAESITAEVLIKDTLEKAGFPHKVICKDSRAFVHILIGKNKVLTLNILIKNLDKELENLVSDVNTIKEMCSRYGKFIYLTPDKHNADYWTDGQGSSPTDNATEQALHDTDTSPDPDADLPF